MTIQTSKWSRREALTAAAAWAGVWAVAARAEEPGSEPLPLHTTGLEHIGMTVPDQKAAAEWYGRIFDPQLFQERDAPPRYYVRMGSAYIAFGGTRGEDTTPKIDHFCALVKDYKPDEMRAALEKAGIKMGAGRFGMPTDDDGIRLQLLGVPGGLAKTIIPSTRITTDDARCRGGWSRSHRSRGVGSRSRFFPLRALLRISDRQEIRPGLVPGCKYAPRLGAGLIGRKARHRAALLSHRRLRQEAGRFETAEAASGNNARPRQSRAALA